jgi:hypothetical protein
MRAFIVCILLTAIAGTSSCRKLGWEKDTKTAECNCVYYYQPGLERREIFKYGPQNSKNSMIMHCRYKTAELEKTYGIGNVRCSPE